MNAAGDRESEASAPDRLSRRSRRRPLRGILISIEAPSISDQPWVVEAIDVNSDGLGVVLPSELEPGTEVLLTCRLEEGTSFSRVPGRVLHRVVGAGGIEFGQWPSSERLRLLEYLVRFYESETGAVSRSESPT